VDFVTPRQRASKNGVVEIYPDFRVARSTDILVQGGSFVAVWDEEKGLWNTDEFRVVELIDRELRDFAKTLEGSYQGGTRFQFLGDYSSKSWTAYRNWISSMPDTVRPLDRNLTFANTEVRKESYATRRLPYALAEGSHDYWDRLISTLYDEDERRKIEWSIGAIVTGASRTLDKFVVLYGKPGSGKSTLINILMQLFEGYYTAFDAASLAKSNNAFATSAFKMNPIVAFQHDGDLSRIDDNTQLNSIISHEEMQVNEKFKPVYTTRIDSFLYMATNKPVQITDAQSGIIRRLIDISPTGNKIPPMEYRELMDGISLELGAIAYYCANVFESLGKTYYKDYRPIQMMYKTDVFYNFVEDSYFEFEGAEFVTLNSAYDTYKRYCDRASVQYVLPLHRFREELKNYFVDFYDRKRIDGRQYRSVYSGFKKDKFAQAELVEHPESMYVIELKECPSVIDELYKDCPAQYAKDGKPEKRWDDVTTTLKDLNTSKEHYVQIPSNVVVIDFDLKDPSGNKSRERNLAEASKWPPTYAETSRSGGGIHLHYRLDNPGIDYAKEFSPGIEIKRFTGKTALRRKYTVSNEAVVAMAPEDLPRKSPKVIREDVVKTEQGLRNLIARNLRKEINPGTKPSVEFIKKILDDAAESGLVYDVTDARNSIIAFAMRSTHHAQYCLKLVQQMKFKNYSEEPVAPVADGDIYFFDIEVFPNLFVICYKKRGDKNKMRLINPTAEQVKTLLGAKLAGFNNRRYDNHIIYAATLGYNNKELYMVSKRIIEKSPNSYFSEAYNVSYTDIYDFSSKRQSLKKWEIELGLKHQELDLDWDQPVPEELWGTVADYCDNDVDATEAVFEHLQDDWTARKMLARISGLTENHSTNSHTCRIIFGTEKNPQKDFVYTDLSEMFPGYHFDGFKSTYRGEVTGEGGYVYAEPGIHHNVALLDVASMHPTSLEQLNLFGPYTKRFSDIKKARILVKHNELDKLEGLFDGALMPLIQEGVDTNALAFALKIVINSVYGLTSAKFENPCKDPRNVDNIVAKRGALFMIDLKHYCQEELGVTVSHIKTDSIKIPNATPEVIQAVIDFGKKYGYDFEHEATYDRMALVNDAVYIAKYDEEHGGGWTATGAQFAHPVVFKSLFSKEEIVPEDYTEVRAVQTAIYLDFNEFDPEDHNLHFVGKVGEFVPVKPNCGGGIALRKNANGDIKDAVNGTKGYRWKEAHIVLGLDHIYEIDTRYSEGLVDKAREQIEQFGSYEEFAA
jgi:energy-coupling factor transporter ATP-binding protein EcfA2